jgi:hypothetical protein
MLHRIPLASSIHSCVTRTDLRLRVKTVRVVLAKTGRQKRFSRKQTANRSCLHLGLTRILRNLQAAGLRV